MDVHQKLHTFAGQAYRYEWWVPGKPVMICAAPVCGIDSETLPIENRYTRPSVVVAGFSSGGFVQLVMWQHLEEYLCSFLALNPGTKLAFFNLGFDVNVMGLRFFLPELMKEGRVIELSANYRLYRMERYGWFPGRTTLESVTKELLNVQLDKDESVRLAYRRDKPVTEAQETYLVEDCAATERCATMLMGCPTETIQARAALVLTEIEYNGLLVDREYVRKSIAEKATRMIELAQQLKNFGYRVKDEADGMKQVERLRRICEWFGYPDVAAVFDDEDSHPNTVTMKWAKMACVVMYRTLEMAQQSQTSVNQALDRLLLVWAENRKDDSAAVKNYYKMWSDTLEVILEKMDSAECIRGLGDAKPKNSAVPYLYFLETLAEMHSLNQLVPESYEAAQKDPKAHMKPFHAAFHELHEENMGWLPTAEKRLSPSAFLQNHARGLMERNPGLQFPYTKGSQKKIRERLKEEKKAAKKERRAERVVDISDLETFQVKKDDSWMLEDLGVADPFLELYFEYKHLEKLLSTYITEKYIAGDGRAHPRFTGILRTGRTSCSSPNLLIINDLCILTAI